MEPGQDGNVELHEGKYLDAGLCTDVGGSAGVGVSVVDGTDGKCSGGGVGSGCGNSDDAGSIGGG